MTNRAAIRQFYQGQAIRVDAQFTDFYGANVIPTGVRLHVKKPNNTVVTIEATSAGSGAFYATVTTSVSDPAGTWHYRFESDSPAAAQEGTFILLDSAVL